MKPARMTSAPTTSTMVTSARVTSVLVTMALVAVATFGFSLSVLAAPIHDAASQGDLATLGSLLAADPSLVNARDEAGHTPLHMAVLGGHVDAARLLADKGADLNAQDLQMYTALGYAAIKGNEEIVDLLAERGAGLEIKNDYGRTPLVLAAREMGGIGVVRRLVAAGADIGSTDKYGDTALTLAAWRGSGDVVDFLLGKGAALPSDERRIGQLMGFSVSNGLTNLFFRMQDQVTDLGAVDETGAGFLHFGAAGGSTRILETLLAKGLDVNQQDVYGWTPLHYAAEKGHLDAAKLLLDRGAQTDVRNSLGQTALVIAREYGDTDIVDLLIARGADQGEARFPSLEGPYLGQTPPGRRPERFAPGIVGGHYQLHSNIAFSPDGKEAFWAVMVPPRGEGYSKGRTMTSRLVGGKWTYPEPAIYAGIPVNDVPFFSVDGTRLYDMSRRPMPGKEAEGKENIWVWEKAGGTWAGPKPLDPIINDLPQHWQFSVDREGNLYFTSRTSDTRGGDDIYCARPAGGLYEAVVNAGDAVNTDGQEGTPFIAPDASYLIFSRDGDLYVAFKQNDGTWSEARSLGPQISSPAPELCPVVSADGKYLFYLTWEGIFWVDAGIIDDLRPN